MNQIRCDHSFYQFRQDAERALKHGLKAGKFSRADRPRIERLRPSGYVLSLLEPGATRK